MVDDHQPCHATRCEWEVVGEDELFAVAVEQAAGHVGSAAIAEFADEAAGILAFSLGDGAGDAQVFDGGTVDVAERGGLRLRRVVVRRQRLAVAVEVALEGLVLTAAHHRLDFVDVFGQLEVRAAAVPRPRPLHNRTKEGENHQYFPCHCSISFLYNHHQPMVPDFLPQKYNFFLE